MIPLAPTGHIRGRPNAAGHLAAALRARLSGEGGTGALVLATRLGGAGLAYAGQVVAARALGQDGFGIYALSLVWLTFVGHLAVGGMNQSLCRHVAAALASGDREAARGFLVFGLAFAVAVGMLCGGIGVATVLLLPDLVDGPYLWPLVLAFLGVPLLAVQDSLEAVSRALNRPLLGIGPTYIVRQGATLLGFAVLALSMTDPTPSAGLLAALGGLLAGILVQVVLLLPAARGAAQSGRRRYDVRRWVRTALPIAFVDGTELLLANADVLVVGLFFPPEIVAAYFAASRIAQILDYVRFAGSAATAQRFAAFAAPGRLDDLRRLAGRVTLATSAAALAGALVLSLAAAPLLGLFGAGFAAYAWLVPILASGMVASCLFGPGEDILTMMGEERACAAAFAISLAVSLALLFALVPAFGIGGAAAATAIGMAVRSLLLAALAFRRLGIALPLGFATRQAHAG